MEENIRLWFEPDPAPVPGSANLPKDFAVAKKFSKGHGRLEERTLTVSSQLNEFLDWPYLQQVLKLERRITTLKTGNIQQQTVYGFTGLSRDEMNPERLLDTIRALGHRKRSSLSPRCHLEGRPNPDDQRKNRTGHGLHQ